MSKDMTNTKTCTSCGETKPIGEFYLRRRSDPNGPRRSTCRTCHSAYSRHYQKNGPSIERKIINEMVKYGSDAYDKFSPEVLEALGPEKPIDPEAVTAYRKRQKADRARQRRREREFTPRWGCDREAFA